MAGNQTVRPANHVRRALGHAGQAIRETLYGSALYRASLRGRRPDALVFTPTDPWPGDAARGAALIGGEFAFGGQRVSGAGGPPWRPEAATAAWLEEAHGFAWLRDLEAVGSPEARAVARQAVDDWIATCGAWEALAWRPDVLGRRVVAWLGHATFVFKDADTDLKARALSSLAEQVRHLGRAAATGPDGELRFAAVKGLLIGALCLPCRDRQLDRGLYLLEHELARQVLADGGHVERSPSAHLRVFQDLVELRTVLSDAKRPAPEALQGVIDRMAPMLRFFRHHDGGLALFNNSNEDSDSIIDLALSLGEATGKPPSRAPHSGFERLTAGDTLVIVDVGAPPPLTSRNTHAGPLSFELSVGTERLIVNCGAHASERVEWREAQRATAAHSTVTINDTNSVEVAPDGVVHRRPRRVTCARSDSADGASIDASHDGYRRPFGLIHRRRLHLNPRGTTLQGRDTLIGGGGISCAARFHLHPTVTAVLVGEGAGALLRTPSGAGWRLRAVGGAVHLAESVYLGRRGVRKRCEQVVVTGPLKNTGATLEWTLTRIESRG